MHEIALPDNETVKPLGKFLLEKFPIGYVRKLFRKNGVRINGQRARENDPVRGGDRLQLYIPFESEAPSARPGARIETIFEDDGLLVINKPAGIAVHEGKTVGKRESILGILEQRYRGAAAKPRLVHRLDQDTSGLLLVAKNERTAEELIREFDTRKVVKEYVCLTAGRLPSGEGRIDLPLPGREGNLVRALTRYRVVKQFATTTFLRVTIDTGRLHQIRLHFARLGYPIVLDDRHGDFGFNKRFRREFGLKRQFLHAEKLKIQYAGQMRQWRAPLAADLQQILRRLEER